MRRRNLIALLLLIVAVGVVGTIYYQQSQNESAAEDTGDAPIQTSTVRRGNLTISATGAGTVIPGEELALAFESSGTLAEIQVEVGQRVFAGDILAVIDDADLQKALADAELAVQQAGLQLDPDVQARTVGLAEIQVAQAQLNLEIAQKALEDAQAFEANDDQVEQAQLSLALAQTNLNNTVSNATDLSIDVASAELNLQTARTELNELTNWEPDWQQVQVLQAQYEAAKASLTVAQQASNSDSALVQAEIALDQARRNLADAEAAVTTAYDPARDWEAVSHECKTASANGQCQQTFADSMARERESADANLVRQQENLRIAEANYTAAQANNSQAGNSNSAQIASAQASVKNAELALAAAQDPPTDVTIAAAQAKVRQAELTLQQVRNNQTNQTGSYNSSVSTARIQVQQQELALAQAQNSLSDAQLANLDAISSAEFNVRQAELNLRQAEINFAAAQDTTAAEIGLKSAELNLDKVKRDAATSFLVAPIDGTILAIDAQVGEAVGTTPIMTLANIDQPVIELYLDETDIGNVKIGNAVEVTFDSMPEEAFSAEIILVDPLLSIANGVTTIRALAAIDTRSLANDTSGIVVGMNGTADVIGGQAQNALLVPAEAIRELSPGQFAVFVMENDEPKLRFVEVGLQDFTFAEIVSGLEQGEVVSTGIIETE